MPKLTVAQLWLVHTLETLFFGSVVTGAISVYQSMGTGNYSASALAAIFIPAVIAVLSKGSASVINNANVVQAGEDTLKQLTASHQNLVAWIQYAFTQHPQQSAPAQSASDPFSNSALMQAVSPPK